jgi:hypothetical protein
LNIGSASGSWHITSGQLVYVEEEFQDLLESCVQLKQLAIALPEAGLEYSTPSAKFPEFYLYITNMAKSCNLKVLSLLGLPTDYASIQSIGFFAAKDEALARLATEIFAIHRSHSTSLQAIAFGTRERADSHLGPRFFIPINYIVRNELRTRAEQVSFTDLQENAWTHGVLGYERRDFDAASRKLFHSVEKEGRDWQGQEDSWPTDGAWYINGG